VLIPKQVNDTKIWPSAGFKKYSIGTITPTTLKKNRLLPFSTWCRG